MSTACVVIHPADQRDAAERFAAALGLDARAISTRRFPDGETLLRLPVPLPDRVLLYCTLNQPDVRLVELMLAARTARAQGVRHLTLVAPYLCYMRQDSAFEPGEAVSQLIVGGFLSELFDAVVTVDPHLHRVERLDQVIPKGLAIALQATEAISAFLAEVAPEAVLVGPDEESGQWVRALAELGQRPHAVFVKQRHGDRDVDVMAHGSAELAGRHVVLVDDIASSGRTLAQAARVCQALGAARVDAVVTHALCSAADQAALHGAGVGRLWSTDSLAHDSNGIALAPLLARGIRAHALI
jgi:ribose-phosphate pyrophosphokinase